MDLKIRVWNRVVGRMWSWKTIKRNSVLALDSNLPNRERFIAFPQADENHVVMLFAGLKDKNGVEIYEGDIMQWEWGDGSVTNEVVDFEDGCFWLGDQAFIDIRTWISKNVVIGNVHENPKLLGGD